METAYLAIRWQTSPKAQADKRTPPSNLGAYLHLDFLMFQCDAVEDEASLNVWPATYEHIIHSCP